MAKQKKVYCCSECGAETANWAGKCPSCGAWNTLVEFNLDSPSAKSASYAKSSRLTQKPKRISELDSSAEIRFTTGISELDRVLGGGAVQGSLVLVGGACSVVYPIQHRDYSYIDDSVRNHTTEDQNG